MLKNVFTKDGKLRHGRLACSVDVSQIALDIDTIRTFQLRSIRPGTFKKSAKQPKDSNGYYLFTRR